MKGRWMRRLFGTNGIRGRIGETLTAELALCVGASVGTDIDIGLAAIGRDCRDSGIMISQALASGIMSTGCGVVDLGVLPTPALQYYVKTHDIAAGVIVTASHNPPEYNGIKCVARDGTEMSQEEECRVEDIYLTRNFRQADWKSIGSMSADPGANGAYVMGIVKLAKKFKLSGFRALVDCGNGAGALTTPRALRALGCDIQTLNAQPDGTFPGHDSEPTEDNLSDLREMCKAGGFDIGLAHDGDADRAVFVDEKGEYVTGDVELALMAREMVRKNGGGKVVVPVDTSRMLGELVRKEGGEIIYTKVGSPIIARKMMATKAVFGGEGNGGMLFPEFQHCRDGLMSAVMMMSLVKGSGKPLSKLASELPKYPLRRWKTQCDTASIPKVLETLQKEFQDGKMVDGLLVEEKDHWVLFRPSGTEPIIRLTLEAMSAGKMDSLFAKYRKMLTGAISSSKK